MPFTLEIEPDVRGHVDTREVSRRVRAMTRALRLETDEVSVVLAGDARVRELNLRYRGKDRPTDVLAFPLAEGELVAFRGALLGDVIVSVPTASRQARRARKTALDEITMLIAHGLLHLLGWDHDTKAKDVAMRAEVARLVAAASAPPCRRASPGATRGRNSAGKQRISAKGGPRSPGFSSRGARSVAREPKKKAET